MKVYFLLFLLGFTSSALAVIDAEVYHQSSDNGYQIFANNNELCPVSIQIDFKLLNLKSSEKNLAIFVVPAMTRGFVLTELDVINYARGYKLSFNTIIRYGDHFQVSYDKDYPYNLPFAKGKSYRIGQGYDGKISHKNVKALDFNMPEKTAVHAARAGMVISVTEENTKGCPSRSCSSYNNFVIVYHDDGTFASYSHLKKNGVVVKVGDEVNKGELIAYSGSTGWVTGPHLHFVVFKGNIKGRETLMTKFLVNDGSDLKFLEEKKTYSRYY